MFCEIKKLLTHLQYIECYVIHHLRGQNDLLRSGWTSQHQHSDEMGKHK